MVEKAPPAHEEFRLAPATRGLNAQLFGYAGDARAHPDRRFPGRLQLLAQSVHWMRLWRSRRLPVARAQPGPWGTWVVAKSNLLELLARELRALEQSGKLERAAVFMSSATDPYQGMERRMRLTRGALE